MTPEEQVLAYVKRQAKIRFRFNKALGYWVEHSKPGDLYGGLSLKTLESKHVELWKFGLFEVALNG